MGDGVVYARPVRYEAHVEHIEAHAAALRSAAVAAGPAAAVLTCPRWTVQRLLGHVGRVYAMAHGALATPAHGDPPRVAPAPDTWDDLLAWWDAKLGSLIERLRATDPEAPAWSFMPAGMPGTRTAAFWARRQAHETAVHRLDAEHARAGSDLPTAVPTLVFDPEFAADGIDELLTVLVPGAARPVELEGRVLYHAADAGRLWVAHLRPGQPIEVGPAEGSETSDDASVVGTADAVYRAVWGRPSTALFSGDVTLLGALRTP